MRYLKCFEAYGDDINLVDINLVNQIPKGETHHDKYNKEYFEKLKDDIRKNGITEPITILYFYKNNTATLGEGHHRLKIANQLNISEVPVQIIVNWSGDTRWNNYNTEHEIYHPPKKLDTTEYVARNYYPTFINPKELGL